MLGDWEVFGCWVNNFDIDKLTDKMRSHLKQLLKRLIALTLIHLTKLSLLPSYVCRNFLLNWTQTPHNLIDINRKYFNKINVNNRRDLSHRRFFTSAIILSSFFCLSLRLHAECLNEVIRQPKNNHGRSSSSTRKLALEIRSHWIFIHFAAFQLIPAARRRSLRLYLQ